MERWLNLLALQGVGFIYALPFMDHRLELPILRHEPFQFLGLSQRKRSQRILKRFFLLFFLIHSNVTLIAEDAACRAAWMFLPFPAACLAYPKFPAV